MNKENNRDLINDPESSIYVNRKNEIQENRVESFINNENGFIENLSKNELELKQLKISRFVNDYCRASPNIILKQKNNLPMGWRNSKYYFEVNFEMTNNTNYNIENVRFFDLFNILKFFILIL